MQASWSHLERSLKTETRLFNKEAEATLEVVFEDIGEHRTADSKSVIIDAGPGHALASLFRARTFASEEKLQHALVNPDMEIGPPPSPLAVAGRMNARGIAVFYGSTAPEIALAEVRPPVGSRVAVACFDITRPLRLLDVEALRSINVKGSVFDRGYIRRLKKAMFLERLSRRITMPVIPEDEPADYLITQAIADYLSGLHDPSIDGIVFPSVQSAKSGKNVVLFHRASRVQPLAVPEGTKISTKPDFWEDVDPTADYLVWERRPANSTRTLTAQGLPWPLPSTMRDPDARDLALNVDPLTIKVHYVKSVDFVTTESDVKRHILDMEEFRISGPPDESDDLSF